MSDAEIDPPDINCELTDNTQDAKNSEDDYLNDVKQFLGLTTKVPEATQHSNDPTQNNTTISTTITPNKETLRRSSRMTTSLYKDYSHVTSFKALPSIKLKLSLLNVPKCKLVGVSERTSTKKQRKNKKREISTEELKKILEESSDLSGCSSGSKTHKKRRRKRMNRVLSGASENAGKVVKTKKVLPKIRKKKRLQTETSKKFHKLRNACRRQYSSHKEYITSRSVDKISTTTVSTKLDNGINQLNKEYIQTENENSTDKITDIRPTKEDNNVSPPNTEEIPVITDCDKPQSEEFQHSTKSNDTIINQKHSNSPSPITNLGSGKHNLPISIPERHSSIAEPLHNTASIKLSNIKHQSERRSLDSCTDIETNLSEQNNNMIYVKSPAAINNSSAFSNNVPTNLTEENFIYTVDDATKQVSEEIATPTNNSQSDSSTVKADLTKKVIFEGSTLSYPGYSSGLRRNSISTTDLFSQPTMALKRAISTGILHKISSNSSKLQTLPQKPQNEQVLGKRKNEDKSGTVKRVCSATYTEHDQQILHPLNPNLRYVKPLDDTLVETAKSTRCSAFHSPATQATSEQQLYPLPQSYYNLARMHYDRLARYGLTCNERVSTPHRTINCEMLPNSESTIQQTYGLNNVCTHVTAPFREKLPKVYVTQCHPLNKSKTSTMQTGVHSHSPSDSIEHHPSKTINNVQGMSKDVPNNNDIDIMPHSRSTTPLTISDSSSAADTDIELEVDVVGNDSVEDKKAVSYSKVVIKKPEILTAHTSNTEPVVPTSTTQTFSAKPFIDEIHKLHKIIEVLFQHARKRCSESVVNELQQIIQGGTTKTPNNLKTTLGNGKTKLNSEGCVRKPKAHHNPTKPITSPMLPRAKSVITTCDQNSKHAKPNMYQTRTPTNELLNGIKRSAKPVNSQLYHSPNTHNYNMAPQYVHNNGYLPIPGLQRYTRPSTEEHGGNYNNTNPQNEMPTRVPHSDQPVDHSIFLKEFARIMYNKNDKYSNPYLPKEQTQPYTLSSIPQPRYKIIEAKPKNPTATITSHQESVIQKSPLSERPPVIYSTNLSSRPDSFHPGNHNLFEHSYLPREVPRSASAEESNARSPDSGYISPAQKISPQLEQIRDAKQISKNINVLTLSQQSSEEHFIQQLLPKLHHCGTLNPEQYVKEMYTLEREQCPPFLMQFYSYVTKKQIASNQLPISFKIFVEFKSAGKLKLYENSFALYLKRRDQERYYK